MKNKVFTFLQKHQLSLQNKTILIGVSGGPDSMALLHLLQSFKDEWNMTLIAVSIDHQLREASQGDIDYVREVCNKWNVSFVSKKVDVKAYEEKYKVSTQVAARTLRYEAYAEQMEKFNGDFLALGHHGDDQVETMLMSLVRTTNLNSLAGIPVKRPFATGEIIRPLLAVTKHEIEQYCKKHKIKPRIDDTNLETYYTRNYFRKYIVPKIKKRHPNVHMTIQQLSETLTEDETYLQKEAEKVFKKVKQRSALTHTKLTLSINELKQFPIPLQRRVYRLTLDYLYEKLPKQLTYSHEQIFLAIISEPTNKIIHFPQKLLMERSYDDLHFYFTEQEVSDRYFQQEITGIPDNIVLPNGAVLTISYIEDVSEIIEDKYTYICSLDELSFPLRIRKRKAGDRMKIRGMEGRKKIKDIFIDDKIPRKERENIFLLEDNEGDIFWLIGVRKGTKKLHDVGPYVVFTYEMIK